MLAAKLDLGSFSLFRLFVILGLIGSVACTEATDTEPVTMLISHVGAAGEDCLWDGASETEIVNGRLDLIGLSASNGGVGHSRRYTVAAKWTTAQEEARNDSEGPNDDFIMIEDVEVRFHFEDATSMPSEDTVASLPATFRVPTGGSSDLTVENRIAVFDLIPTWIAQRLAADRQIWLATSHDGYPRAGKRYQLPMEFRLNGTNLGGRSVTSNWFRWVINLCRGCALSFSCSPPVKCAKGVPSLAGSYTSADLGMDCPQPQLPGVVRWCHAGANQGGPYSITAVCPTSPISVSSFDVEPEGGNDDEEGQAP